MESCLRPCVFFGHENMICIAKAISFSDLSSHQDVDDPFLHLATELSESEVQELTDMLERDDENDTLGQFHSYFSK